MTITEFLTARCEEDEAVVVALRTRTSPRHHPKSWRADLTTDEQGEDGITLSPERMLSDIAAKRAIVAQYVHHARRSERQPDQRSLRDAATAYYWVVLALLQPFAEHPDFDPAWRVS